MRCRVHVLDRLSGRVFAAELTTGATGGLTIVLVDGRTVDPERRRD
jgi:hypothetical protein